MIVDEPTSRRLAASTRFGDIRHVAEVDSTNRYLLEVARAGAPEGVVVVADHQTQGRGRRGRSWEASRGGALLVSILLRPDPSVITPRRRWLVTAAAALAAADACQAVCADRRVEIKWPNDLLVEDRKLAGILAESDGDAVVVGVGVNVAWAPPGAARLGPSVDRGRLLAAVLTKLDRCCDRWEEVAGAYRTRCATVGRQVRVELPSGLTVVGRAEAVDGDGRLRVAPEGGAPTGTAEILVVSAGDVVHVVTRPYP